VIAQITNTFRAMMRIDQNGWYGMKKKLTIALRTARAIASAAAHSLRKRRPTPPAATRIPMMRWIQPHPVISTSCV
jgi:hypothetical protein